MSEALKEKRRFTVILAFVCLVILLSVFLFIQVFQQFRTTIFEKQESNLQSLVQSTDRNINKVLTRCTDEFEYIIGLPQFQSAQRLWLEEKDGRVLCEQMRNNLLTRQKLITDMFLISAGKIELSAFERPLSEYSFPNGLVDSGMCLCILPDGEIAAAFVLTDSKTGLMFAILMDMQEFYRQTAGAELTEDEWVLLYNPQYSIILRTHLGNSHVDRIDATTSATWIEGGVEILLSYEETCEIGTEAYSFRDHANGSAYDDIIVVYPTAKSENGQFAIGIAGDCTALYRNARNNALLMFLCASMIFASGFILVYMAVRSNRSKSQIEKDLTLLKEKNQATEELLRKTNELAHHQRLESIGVMTAGIAHEFNNLMTPIMSYSLLALEKTPEDSEAYDGLLEIYTASRKAKSLVSRLSAMSRSGVPSGFKNVAPPELIRRVLALTASVKPENVTVRQNINCGEKCLHGDETQLVQLFLNIIINAYHAMEKGGILSIDVETDNKFITFRVTDTGYGIDEANLAHIFEPFFTTKESGKGTGLGLAIAAQVVATHNGCINAQSEKGKGAVFTIALPAFDRYTDVLNAAQD